MVESIPTIVYFTNGVSQYRVSVYFLLNHQIFVSLRLFTEPIA